MKLATMLRSAVSAAALTVLAPGHAAEMRAFDSGSLQAIKSAKAGRPFVVVFWSIYCAPCIEDMADWRELRARHPTIPVILVLADAPADRARASRLLEEYPPGDVELWAFADDFGERTRYAVDRTWRGELPRTYFFDPSGRIDVVTGRLDRRWADNWFNRQR
ncbi:MAG TPA: hypothetical protein VMK32_01185 [Burkholderiaceae bacterium]|nr:hypothetical protein [Burkholderiaceae bacterium]